MNLHNYTLRFSATEDFADGLYVEARETGAGNAILRRLDHPVDKDHQVVSIQVAATCHADGDICVVEESSGAKTHYSVYTRGFDGLCTHVKDFDEKGEMEMARIEAMAFAADLSMQYQVPIEKIN